MSTSAATTDPTKAQIQVVDVNLSIEKTDVEQFADWIKNSPKATSYVLAWALGAGKCTNSETYRRPALAKDRPILHLSTLGIVKDGSFTDELERYSHIFDAESYAAAVLCRGLASWAATWTSDGLPKPIPRKTNVSSSANSTMQPSDFVAIGLALSAVIAGSAFGARLAMRGHGS